MTAAPLRIHAAPWVVPVCGPIIADGGVAVSTGTIVGVGGLAELQQRYPQAEVRRHPGAALTPALINGHIHLELSHLAELAARPLNENGSDNGSDGLTGSFTGWISRLLQLRDALGADTPPAELAAMQVAAQQYRDGVSVLADIGNTLIGHHLAETFPGTILAFKEYLGLAEFTLAKNSARLQQEPDQALCSGHAPYSTHARLLQQLKARAAALGQVFPIHAAEPPAEMEMIRHGRGEMVDFIRRRGFWDDSFVPLAGETGGSISYLHQLGLLDPLTLCIHAIHVSPEEIRILAGQGSKVCLCPGSNQFLNTGLAPVQAYLDHGILPALGTDSLASNPELSLWREMQLLATAHPTVEHAEIFAMATRGGAEALGLDNRLGTLEAAKDADLLLVPVPPQTTTAGQVYAHMVTRGSALAPSRLQG